MYNYGSLHFKYTYFIVVFLFYACVPEKKINDDLLWYNQPAKNWNEALPLGNGKLGVMVFGNTTTERIQLNDDSMWPADSGDWTEPEGNKKDLKEIRELLFDGKNEEADKLFVDKFSRKKIVRSHQTLGDLFIAFDHQNISDYRRELNISNATATVTYKSNGSLITEKIFVSHPDKAVLIEISSEAAEGLNAKLRLSRPKDKGFETAKVFTTDEKLLVMEGEVSQRDGVFNSAPYPILNGVKFETSLKVNNKGGIIERGADYLELKNVKKATIYLVSNSSYYYYYDSYQQQNKIDMQALTSKSFAVLKKEHIKDYQNLYGLPSKFVTIFVKPIF